MNASHFNRTPSLPAIKVGRGTQEEFYQALAGALYARGITDGTYRNVHLETLGTWKDHMPCIVAIRELSDTEENARCAKEIIETFVPYGFVNAYGDGWSNSSLVELDMMALMQLLSCRQKLALQVQANI